MNTPEGMGRPDSTAGTGRGVLAISGLAAILASTCCLGPLVLLMLGISGAWIGQLRALEPYRPIFIGVAVFALVLAARPILRPITRCAPGEVCAIPAVKAAYRRLFWVVAGLIAVALVYPYLAPYFY